MNIHLNCPKCNNMGILSGQQNLTNSISKYNCSFCHFCWFKCDICSRLVDDRRELVYFSVISLSKHFYRYHQKDALCLEYSKNGSLKILLLQFQKKRWIALSLTQSYMIL